MMAILQTAPTSAASLKALAYRSEQSPAMVVIDAGIATTENLKTIKEKGYHYLCVSRSKLKDYKLDSNRLTTIYERQEGKKLTLKKNTNTPRRYGLLFRSAQP